MSVLVCVRACVCVCVCESMCVCFVERDFTWIWQPENRHVFTRTFKEINWKGNFLSKKIISILNQILVICLTAQERSEPNNSRVPCAEVMMLSTKFPLVLRLQLNEQQKVKAVWVSGTDSMVKCGLAAVQIGTALLVKVSVFWCLVWNVYSLKCWTAWTVKVETVICRESW